MLHTEKGEIIPNLRRYNCIRQRHSDKIWLFSFCWICLRPNREPTTDERKRCHLVAFPDSPILLCSADPRKIRSNIREATHSSFRVLLECRGKICYLFLTDNREDIISVPNVNQAIQIDIHFECRMVRWQSKQPLYDLLDERGSSTGPDVADACQSKLSVSSFSNFTNELCSLATVRSRIGWLSN